MLIYTVAIESPECYGHGDFGYELRITKMGSYGSGTFPPAFKSHEKATEWIKENENKFYSKPVVVALNLFD